MDFKFDLDNKNLTETKIYNDSAPADEYEFLWADGAMVSGEIFLKIIYISKKLKKVK